MADRPLCILLVEDEELTREAVAIWLESRGYQVVQAGSGTEALQVAGEAEIDAALVDVRLPRMLGTDVVDRLRESRPDLPVILMSAYLDAETRRRARELGISQILSKPFPPETLSRAIQAAMEGRIDPSCTAP